MEQEAQVRVAGPSRVVLAAATGALVALTSGATAFVVLTGTGVGVGPQAELEPRPPAAAPPAQLPFVELPAGAALATQRTLSRPDGAGSPTRPVDPRPASPRQASALPFLGEAPLMGPTLPPAELALAPLPGAVEVEPEDALEPVFGPRVPPPGPAVPAEDLPSAWPPVLPAEPAVPAVVTGDRAVPAVPAVPAARSSAASGLRSAAAAHVRVQTASYGTWRGNAQGKPGTTKPRATKGAQQGRAAQAARTAPQPPAGRGGSRPR